MLLPRFFPGGETVRLLTYVLVVLGFTMPAHAQAPKIDFKRDVQPILKEHCISCHGPTQQMNGFRLDRRSAAMRGGTFPVIGPGNATGSRFYLRLIGTQFGQQMPPAGRLDNAQIDILKNWIDQGAEWPDDVSGEKPPVPLHPVATRLMQALRRGDRADFTAALAADSSGARAFGSPTATPLMYAALYGDAEAVRRLLSAGADPNISNDAGTTAVMWAVGDEEKTRLLLDAGANPEARGDDGRTPLMIAAARHGSSRVAALLLAKGAKAAAASANRTTALRLAAGTGDAELMKTLIDGGADLKADAGAAFTQSLIARCISCAELLIGAVDPQTFNGTLFNMVSRKDVAAVRLLVDRGANVNARDDRGRTPLMMACASDFYSPDVVRFLIQRGADITARSESGETAMSLALLRGGPVVDLLAQAGAARPKPQTPGALSSTPSTEQVASRSRAAVQRSLPILQKTDVTFQSRAGCVSCHNNSLTTMTLDIARKRRFAVDETVAADQVRKVATYLESWRESTLRGFGIPGGQDTVSYIVVGLGAAKHPSDAATDAMAYYLKTRQAADGRWPVQANRPPIESSDFQVTAMSMRALQLYAPAPQRAEYEQAIARAAAWLRTAVPASTEDRAFQILGLTWAGSDKGAIRTMAGALLDQQSADGGWTQFGKSASMPSDAYATGQALFALSESGMLAPTDRAFVRGARFLLDAQLADGSWLVRSRANPIQAYFESDFPHGTDQFVSAAGTNWATMALAIAAGPAN
jgi:ankyrin repeat protein